MATLPSAAFVAAQVEDQVTEGGDSLRAFSEEIDVRVVNVEAVVTDRKGTRVPGLTPEDFQLRVDGELVPVEYFTEVREGGAIEPKQVFNGDLAEAPRGIPAVDAGGPVGTGYLIFVDDYFCIAAERNRVLARLQADLARLSPEDKVAVVAFDGRRLSLLTPWTSDREAVDRALLASMARDTHGLQLVARKRSLLSGREERERERLRVLSSLSHGQALTLSGSSAGEISGQELEYARFLTEQLEIEISAINSALRGLSPLQGRKVALLLSGGWTFEAIEEARDEPGTSIGDSASALPSGETLYQSLTETANLLGYTLYPVDVRGLVGVRFDLGTTEGGGPGRGGLLDESQRAEPARQEGAPGVVALLPEHNVHSTFLHLAAQTGGKAMLNGLRDVALERTVEDTRSYYWLGFTAPRSGDGSAHRIELEVLRPELEVRARKSYLDMTREQEVNASVEGLLLFPEGGEGDGVEALPIRAGAAERAARKTIELPLTLGIPVAKVTILPQGGKWVGDLELRIATMDEDGARSEMPVVPLHLEASKEPSDDGMIRYDTRVTLRRIPQDLVVAVYDPASGTLLASRLAIDPEEALRAARASER